MLVVMQADATPEQHVAWGTVSSAEALARVIPALAARARAAAFDDPVRGARVDLGCLPMAHRALHCRPLGAVALAATYYVARDKVGL